jgi:hypothetical protein
MDPPSSLRVTSANMDPECEFLIAEIAAEERLTMLWGRASNVTDRAPSHVCA